MSFAAVANRVWDNIFIPALVTAVLHGVLIYIAASGVNVDSFKIVPTVLPDYIQASLVAPPQKKAPVKKAPAPLPKPVVEQLQTPQALPQLSRYETPDVLAAIDQSRLELPEFSEAIDPGFLSALEAEAQRLEEESDLQTIAKHEASITAAIQAKWSRPPSARNGMQVLLAIRLVPSGEVVSVAVQQGSGNAAFDRSAINAVWQVERFAALAELENRLFEEYFRELNLLFKPEDLLL